MEFVDTHCHIHSADYKLDTKDVLRAASQTGIANMICVGTDAHDSKLAIEFVQNYANCWASIGIHPHSTKHYKNKPRLLTDFANLAIQPKVVAIGECGLDYYYNYSEKTDQKALLRFQLELAKSHNLPLIFHIREAFDDFWPIFDEFAPLPGVVHSFTDTRATLDQALSRGLLIGLNGIMTFTRDQNQLEMAKTVPLNRLVLETDAPYLTPVPFRGKVCEPSHILATAEFLADLRAEELKEVARVTTNNARKLFGLN